MCPFVRDHVIEICTYLFYTFSSVSHFLKDFEAQVKNSPVRNYWHHLGKDEKHYYTKVLHQGGPTLYSVSREYRIRSALIWAILTVIAGRLY